MGLFNSKCLSNARLDGKIAVITGGNTGIGKETARDFYLRGAKVIIACRNIDKAHKTIENIEKENAGKKNLGELQSIRLDLANLESVRECAENLLKTHEQINLLINNAGIMMCPETRTIDAFELQFQTNHLGHFLLTLLLLPKIIKSPPARIVNVSSVLHQYGHIDFDDINFERRKYSSLQAYQQSKLANVLFTKELARKLDEWNVKNVNVYSLHPGVIATELGRHLDATLFPGGSFMWSFGGKIFSKTPLQGAQTTIYCAVDEGCSGDSGGYYAECRLADCSDKANDLEVAKKLWEISLRMVGLNIDCKL